MAFFDVHDDLVLGMAGEAEAFVVIIVLVVGGMLVYLRKAVAKARRQNMVNVRLAPRAQHPVAVQIGQRGYRGSLVRDHPV